MQVLASVLECHRLCLCVACSTAIRDLHCKWILLCFQVAGYVTEYEENDFKFVTVKGAGHMVSGYSQ